MNKGINNEKKILITSTDVMMIQFLIPHVKHLINKGYAVDVACSSADGYQKENYEQKIKELLPSAVHFYHVRTRRSPFSIQNIKGLKDLKRIINTNNYDLVWTNEPVMGIMTRIASKKQRRRGTKVIYMVHGFHFFKGAPLKNWLYYPIEKFYSRYCDAIITINWEDYNLTKKRFNVPVFHIDGIGLDVKRFGDIKCDCARKRAELGFNANDILLLSVGELQTRKNHEVVIRALPLINNRNIKYLICGRGELLGKLQKLAIRLRVNEQVFFLGHRYDIDEILSTSDIFVHPSQREGLGIAAIEAMATGLPLVTSNVQGIKDYVNDGVNGYLLEPYDVNGFAVSISKLLNDEALRKQMGKKNREDASKYDISLSVKNVESIIKSIFEEVD